MTVAISDQDGIRRITLDRPRKRNALNSATMAAICDALEAAAADAEIRAVVLAGNGVVFSAGGDLAEMAEPATEAQKATRTALMLRLFDLPATLPLPVIAAVHGSAVGAGAALALACDMMVMAADATLVWPEAKHRIAPTQVAPPLIARVPRAVAFDLLATSRPMLPEEARHLGLAARVVPPEALAAEAHRLAVESTLMPSEMLLALKRMIAP